ncbi:hypothetical protein LOC70_23935 [Rhodopirellula sp. JC737]|nr:hypothetical protein [Rhodopirellula sp. JC737]
MAAPNQTSLVAALCEMDVFFERCADDGDLADDESADRQMREECTKLIGGSEYAEFVQLFFWS